VKTVREVGFGRVWRFLWASVLLSVLRYAWLPPIRAVLLRAYGARVGRHTIIHRLSLINVDRGGFRALVIGDNCFVGDEVLIDLAAPVHLEDHVTLAVRAQVLTHMNVGYRDHPLQARFPPQTAPVMVRRGSFIGAGSIILAGITVGPESFVAAGSLVTRDVPPGETVGGIPARALRGSIPSE
jgi:putative colanic acid biosynthesis acetyltransferase WcaF